MKNTWKWILGIALVLVLFFGPYLFQLVFPTVGYGYGMMGSGRGSGMMGGFGFFPFGMGLMWLIPLGTIALIVLGVVWLVNNTNSSKTVQGKVCPSCGKPAQTDWKTCPYCGNGL
ncbi:MAG: zinc ribbon domain-containing protein [Anaerolineae bacterium]|nr:zinc ribbon domain-containing protein [Anaerolineae bacterium]